LKQVIATTGAVEELVHLRPRRAVEALLRFRTTSITGWRQSWRRQGGETDFIYGDEKALLTGSQERRIPPTSVASMTAWLLAAAWWDRNAGLIGLAGVILGLIGLAAGAWFYWLQRDTKSMEWEVLTDEEIVTAAASQAPEEGIRVTWKGNVLYEPRLVTIRLLNSGKREIRREDFQGPINVTFIDQEIVAVSWAGHRDGMIGLPEFVWHQEDAAIKLGLHNRGDWTDIQFLLHTGEWEKVPDETDAVRPAAAGASQVKVGGVIAGQTRPMHRRPYANSEDARKRRLNRALYVLILLGYGFGVLTTLGLYLLLRPL
jgi:hypothetical protein